MARRLLCFGHRGAAGHEPENTLLSVEKAIALGADWIEVDVHGVGDELLVIHDETLERTTNGKGRISEKSLDYLRSLDAGKGERIPFLGEVFDLVGRKCGINIELKGANTATPTVRLIERYVDRHARTYDRFLVSSFDAAQLKAVRALQPKVNVGVLAASGISQAISLAADLGAYALHPKVSLVSRRVIQEIHEKGVRIFAFTVNEATEIRRMKALGVDGLFTDYPERVIAAG